MKKQIFVIQIILCLVLMAGCNLPMQARTEQAAVEVLGPEAWIDAPLDDMHIPLGVPYDVVFHITADTAVTRGELSINGDVVATLDNPNPESNLATLHYSFTPSQPGEYKLQARAQDSGNAWSESFDATVFVDELTPTITPTQIITPTITATLTPTETITPSPTPVLEKGFAGRPVFSPYQINLPYDCLPSNLTAEIKVNPGQKIKVVVLFYRPSNNDFTQRADWADIAMTPVGADTYRITFNPIKAGGFKPWFGSVGASAGWEGWLQTQFVIQDMDGVLTRSPLYSDVKIAGCH
jgi:hypothetical protein